MPKVAVYKVALWTNLRETKQRDYCKNKGRTCLGETEWRDKINIRKRNETKYRIRLIWTDKFLRDTKQRYKYKYKIIK